MASTTIHPEPEEASMTRSSYNATVLTTVESPVTPERVVSMCVAAVDNDGYMLRSNAALYTGDEETRAYHEHFLEGRERLFGYDGYHVYYVPGTDYYCENAIGGPRTVPAEALEPVFWRTHLRGSRYGAVAD